MKQKKTDPLKEAFGSLKAWKIDSQKMKDDFREEDRRSDERLTEWLKERKFKYLHHLPK